jgi:hypothetical protein
MQVFLVYFAVSKNSKFLRKKVEEGRNLIENLLDVKRYLGQLNEMFLLKNSVFTKEEVEMFDDLVKIQLLQFTPTKVEYKIGRRIHERLKITEKSSIYEKKMASFFQLE